MNNKPPFFSQNDLGKIAKCLGGQIKQLLPGLPGKLLIAQFKENYPRVASTILGRAITYDMLEQAYMAATNRGLTNNILLQRFDKYIRYSEVDPDFADRVRKAVLQVPPSKTTIKQVKPETFVTASVIAKLLSISESAVYRFAKTGHLPAHRIGGTVRFLVSEVLENIK
jgi:excisionase family DNA binding protein